MTSEQNQTQSNDRVRQLLFTLGRSYLERHQNEAAYEKFQQYLELDPENEEACFFAAIAGIRTENISEPALNIYARAVACRPESEQLLSSLAKLLRTHQIESDFAEDVIERANSLAHSEEAGDREIFPEQPSGGETPGLKAVDLKKQLEGLWWQGAFQTAEETINRFQAESEFSEQELFLLLALTKAYQHLGEKRRPAGKTLELLAAAADEIEVSSNMTALRDFITLRSLTEPSTPRSTQPQTESDEFLFILGLIPMDEFFNKIQTASNGYHVMLGLDFWQDLMLPLANGESVNLEHAWYGYLLVEITSPGSRPTPEKLVNLVASHLQNIPHSLLLKSGAGFLCLAVDPTAQLQAAIHLMRSIDSFNAAVPAQETIRSNCALLACDKSRKLASRDLLKQLVCATHLLRLAQLQDDFGKTGTFLLKADRRVRRQFDDQQYLRFSPQKEIIVPGETSRCVKVLWQAPAHETVRKHAIAIGDLKLKSCLKEHERYVTFLGEDRQLARPVVVRALQHQQALPYLDDKKALAKLYNAIRKVGHMSHPNISTLFDMGNQHLVVYYAREYVEGEAISSWDRDRPNWEGQLTGILLKILGALKYAHSQGTPHLNLKPSNIRVDEGMQVKLVDFYLSDFSDNTPGRATNWRYLHPKISKGKVGDMERDLFSIAIICYEILEGQHPFEVWGFETMDDVAPDKFNFQLKQELRFAEDWQVWLTKAVRQGGNGFKDFGEAEAELRALHLKLLQSE